MMYKLFTVSVLVLLSFLALAQKTTGFNLVERADKKQIDILYNNMPSAAYCYTKYQSVFLSALSTKLNLLFFEQEPKTIIIPIPKP